ncbi:MAG: NYN domain-containing protein [Pseudanabaenaceae cyanobacterium SKYGB_i_bin29]|nr:NYN domain-containing protein [Pseudanabaenaceae cyanobacterium SKYG29]MDW8422360.1 NYN domain-containing protein [Pseudanabaenaceae cyanobacterium SKYGB_i_bin29]
MSPPVMLVDGYNVVGTWQSLQELKSTGNIALARDRLVEILASYSAYRGFHTTIVFDAYNQPHPGSTEDVTQYLKLHYTDYHQTADSYIEKVCAQLRKLRRIIVVTSDRAQQLTVGGFGAEWMSALHLEQDVRSAQKSMHRKQRAKIAPQRRLHSVMKEEVRKKLTEWRTQLSQ